jgi:MerR family transcriptional regulator, light-induced transcriptional regulator
MANNEAGRALHPISVVAERTGLSPDLLRVWERRYGVVEPGRDQSGRRLYSDSDIERLKLLSQATAGGRSIGQLLELSTAELAELTRSDEAARWRPSRPVDGETEESFVDRAFRRTTVLDGAGLEAELSRAAAVVGAGRFMDAVVSPLCRRIGDGWHGGEVSIAQEHMATRVVQRVMGRLLASLPVESGAATVVVATASGDRHEIGALLAAGAAALEGWRVTYLGADLPASEIAAAATDVGARVVALSSVYPDGDSLERELRTLRELLPADVELVVGGPGISALNGTAIPGLKTLADLAGLRRTLAEA